MTEGQEYPQLARRSILSGLGVAAAGGLIASATGGVAPAQAQSREPRERVPSILAGC